MMTNSPLKTTTNTKTYTKKNYLDTCRHFSAISAPNVSCPDSHSPAASWHWNRLRDSSGGGTAVALSG